MKVDAVTYRTHNPFEETHWVSRLRENFMSGSDGEGLETGKLVPRQPLTRQLFFKWIKQNLRIKSFYGTSENAVKTQVWIAISVYVLIAIIKKRLNLELSFYTILQIFSVTVFEQLPIIQILTDFGITNQSVDSRNQLLLFEL